MNWCWRFLRAPAAVTVMLAALLLVPSVVHADDPVTLHVEAVDDSAFPIVRAVVRVDVGGRPLESLVAPDISVRETSAPAIVENVARASDGGVPLGLVLVIDVSGSMAGPALQSAKESAASMVRSLAATDDVALVVFSDSVVVVEPMTRNHGAVLAAIERLVPAGNTALHEAVGTGVQLAAASGLDRRAVVLLSDGFDFGAVSVRTREQALDAVRSSGVIVYAVGLGNQIDSRFLNDVAVRSGGQFLAAPTIEQMAAAFGFLESLLRSQFVVTFRSAAPAELRERNLSLTVRAGGQSGSTEYAYQTRRTSLAPGALPVTEQAAGGAATAARVDSARGWPVAAVVIGTALLAVVVFVIRRRRRPTVPSSLVPSHPDLRPMPLQELPPHTVGTARGVLIPIAGAGLASPIALEDHPVTFGTAASCEVHLPAVRGVAREHARIWLREDRAVVHHLGRDTVTTVNERPVDWASLTEGDELAIGPYVFRFEPTPRGADVGGRAAASGGAAS